MASRIEELLKVNEVVQRRWKIEGKLAAGGFGQIFKAFDLTTNEEVALKAEPASDPSKEVLRIEIAVLRKLQGKIHAAKFYGCGRCGDYNYLVMQLLSRNIGDLRRESPLSRFSHNTTFRLGIQGVQSLQDLHEVGFLHRDIKPSNYSLGLTGNYTRILYILDFGLARQYVNEDGHIRNPRNRAGFRGTVRYASINTHLQKELGRHDDLWSLYYMLIELATGQLPWRRLRNKEDVGVMKQKTTLEELCENLPPLAAQVGALLRRQTYFDAPDYAGFDKILRRMLREMGAVPGSPFDWENDFANLQEELQRNPVAKKIGMSSVTKTSGTTGRICDGPPSAEREKYPIPNV